MLPCFNYMTFSMLNLPNHIVPTGMNPRLLLHSISLNFKVKCAKICNSKCQILGLFVLGCGPPGAMLGSVLYCCHSWLGLWDDRGDGISHVSGISGKGSRGKASQTQCSGVSTKAQPKQIDTTCVYWREDSTISGKATHQHENNLQLLLSYPCSFKELWHFWLPTAFWLSQSVFSLTLLPSHCLSNLWMIFMIKYLIYNFY